MRLILYVEILIECGARLLNITSIVSRPVHKYVEGMRTLTRTKPLTQNSLVLLDFGNGSLKDSGRIIGLPKENYNDLVR